MGDTRRFDEHPANAHQSMSMNLKRLGMLSAVIAVVLVVVMLGMIDKPNQSDVFLPQGSAGRRDQTGTKRETPLNGTAVNTVRNQRLKIDKEPPIYQRDIIDV